MCRLAMPSFNRVEAVWEERRDEMRTGSRLLFDLQMHGFLYSHMPYI